MSALAYSTLLLQLLCFIQWTANSTPSSCTTLGVNPTECNRYDSKKDPYFYCGGSKDKKIPMKYVNDDYCDCVHTGDDEPGTSACNHGKFWCVNKGYKGHYIYSSLVNDGLCDCCDGSDEIKNPRIKCPNICNQKAQEELQEFINNKKKYMEGIKVKNSLLQVAKSKLNEKKQKKSQILQDLEHKRAELKEKETLKKIAEDKESNYKEEKKVKQEAEQAAQEAERKAQCEAEGRSNCDDPTATDETHSESVTDTATEPDASQQQSDDNTIDKEETPRERRRRERRERYERRAERNRERREKRNSMREGEAKQRMDEIKEKYETPKEVPPEPEVIHTPDEEFPYPEEYRPHAEDGSDEEVVHTPDEEFPYPEEYRPHIEESEESDGEVDDGFDWSEFDDEEIDDYDIHDVPPMDEEEVVESDPVEDELRDKARDARNAYNDVNREITRLEDDLKDIEKVLEMDFGEKDVYASLFDECYSMKINKYDYEFCPFVKAQQKEGHSSTDMGKFKSFEYNNKNELIMSFDEGQKCWNGPKRSVDVLFKCNTEHKIIDVLEPSTCKYSMTFNTPLACQQKELDELTELINNQFKTEL